MVWCKRAREEGDRRACLFLLEEYLASLGMGEEQAAARRYRWLYEENPHGQAVTYVARGDDGEPLGMTSLFPRRVLVAGRERVGSIGGDGYVRPVARRRGVATRLHEAARSGLSEGLVEFMYGPPKPHNLQALLRAGSTMVGEAQRFSRLMGPGGMPPRMAETLDRGLLRRALTEILRPGQRGAAELQMEALGPEPDARVDVVCEQVSAGLGVVPLRDAAYYAWRFARSPRGRQRGWLLSEGGRPRAVVALEQQGGRAAILDMLCEDARRGAVLRTLLRWLSAHGCNERVTLEIHVPGLAALRPALLAAGFLPRGRLGFQVLARPGDAQAALLLQPEAWGYLWGDGDVEQVL